MLRNAIHSTLVVVLSAVTGLAAEPLSRPEIAKRGKAATALVEVKFAGGQAHGSAFCIHPSGLFVTNEHVVRRVAEGGSVTLILNPSLKDQRIVTAKVVRGDKDKDLALLRLEERGEPLPVVELGLDDALSELDEVIAVGFPFGTNLRVEKDSYPAVSINAGSVTSLRRKSGELERIQLDAALNPGNSGGPVLDKYGKVVGIVVSGVLGTGVNQAIPVSQARRFLAKPDLAFTPPVVSAVDKHRPVMFQVRAASLLPDAKPLKVDLLLRPEGGAERRVAMELVGGTHRVAAVLVPVVEGTMALRLELKYPSGVLSGSITDRAFRVGDREVKLSAVRLLRLRPKSEVVLLDGKTIEGPITALGMAPIDVGSDTINVNLAKATEVKFEPATEPTSVRCTVIAMQDGVEVGRMGETVAIQSAASPAIVSDGSPAPRIANAPMIQAPTLTEDRVVRKLPGTVADVAVGGGGRFLLLNLPDARKIAVFDANEARVIKYITMPDDELLLTAGLENFFIAMPTKNVLQRWSLTTFERELTVPLLPGPGSVRGFAMGSASNGPLAVGVVPPEKHEDGSFLFFDPRTMKPMAMKWKNTTGPVNASQSRPLFCDSWYLRASADGTCFALRPGIGGEGHEMIVMSLRGTEVSARHAWMPASLLRPSHDGRVLYAPDGIYSAELQFLHPKPKPEREDMSKPFLPACQGSFFLRLQPNDDKGVGSVHLYLPAGDRSLAKLDGVEGVFHERISYGNAADKLTHDKRIHFIADAKILVTVPNSKDQLLVYRFDLDKMIDASGVDYLFVSSTPIASAKKGETYRYQLAVKSKKGGVKFKLDSGPEGMAVSADGRLTWTVPTNASAKEVDVIVTVSDASGQEVFHSFKVQVGG